METSDDLDQAGPACLKRTQVLGLRLGRCLPMPGVRGFDWCSEILDGNDLRARILRQQDAITEQRDHVQPLVRRALESRVVEVVAVDVNACSSQFLRHK